MVMLHGGVLLVRAAALGLVTVGIAATGAGLQSERVQDAAGVSAAQTPKGATGEAARLYGLAGDNLLWTEDREDELLRILAGAPRHGLDMSARIAAVKAAQAGPGDMRQRDLALSQAALAYADALAHGVVDPARLHEIYTLPRNRVDLAAGLNAALSENRLAAWFESLAPADPAYRAMAAAYAAERAAAASGGAAKVPEGPSLRPKGRDGRVPVLSQSLVRAGELKAPVQGNVYGPELVAAVRRLQARSGLVADGVVGPATLGVLNRGPAERARALAVNMERLRWQERIAPATRIVVNIPSASMQYLRSGAVAWEGRVVVGSPDNQTPLLGQDFDRLVLNPPWNVPKSIAEAEILPKGRRYLVANDMTIKDGRVIQKAGPKSALGLVKFDMENPYAIYLHDTPQKALFGAANRHRSHGCVRVENAVAFARKLAEERGLAAEFDRKLQAGDTAPLALGEAIPVRLIYLTVQADPSGRLIYLPDVYGFDDKVAEALGLGAGAKLARVRAERLLGP